jgi:hypothetical protein
MIASELARHLSLGDLFNAVRARYGAFELMDHWQQGEFHHDLVLRMGNADPILVVATNCNGGVKEVVCFDGVPERGALWHDRCPDNPEFSGVLPPQLDRARTVHWFDPCELLGPEARSEYRPEFRERQPGGGWQPRGCGTDPSEQAPD